MSEHWSNVLGNYLLAQGVWDHYVKTHKRDELLAEWIERQSAELWGDEHDPSLNFTELAQQILDEIGN